MMKASDPITYARIPMQHIGPIKLIGPEVEGDIMVPLATYETPLWPSTNRGARVSVVAGGLRVVIVDERMTRSVLLEAPDAVRAARIAAALPARHDRLSAIVSEGSRFARFADVHTHLIRNCFLGGCR